MRLRIIRVARHGVLIGFQSGPGIGQGVDDPERFHLALILARDGEFLGVLRPGDVGARACAAGLSFALLLFALILLLLLLVLNLLAATAAAPAIPEVLFTVLGELGFDDGGVIGALQGLGVILGVHHVKVVIACEHHGFAVGGNVGPGWPG